jgi:hypothetical protein
MVLTIRRGPSGPPSILSDTLVDPGEVLGNPLDATAEAPAEPLVGAEVGAIVRYGGFASFALAPGTYNNFEIPDGVQVIDIDPQAGTVVITGIKVLGDRGNAGAFLTIGKFGSDGALILTNLDAGSDAENQIITPDGLNYEVFSGNETMDLQVIDRDADTTKWQVIDRLIPGSGVASELGGFGVPVAVAVTFPAGGGGAADDVTIMATVPYQVRVLDVILMTSTAVVGSSAVVRNQAGGAGTALSSTLATAATGTVRNNDTATRTTSLGLFLRRSDSGVAGTVVVVMNRV